MSRASSDVTESQAHPSQRGEIRGRNAMMGQVHMWRAGVDKMWARWYRVASDARAVGASLAIGGRPLE